MSVTYHIEIEHQTGSWLARVTMPWRNRRWTGHYGRYTTAEDAYHHVNTMLDEACSGDSPSDRCTGRWRIVRRSVLDPQDEHLINIVGGRVFNRTVISGWGPILLEEGG